MGTPRRFDWDEARRLRAEGLGYTEIGRRLGVSRTAIQFACDEEARRADLARKVAWQRNGVCPECGGPATRNGGDRQYRCRACANLAMATTVRPTELQCQRCREWKPDRDFPRNRTEPTRRGRHKFCTRCGTEIRREYREARKVPCRRCGTPVLAPGNGQHGNTGLCRSCYFATVRATASVGAPGPLSRHRGTGSDQ